MDDQERGKNAGITTDEQELLKVLLGHHQLHQCTDIHVRSDEVVMFRARGVLAPANNWEQLTDGTGRLLPDKPFQRFWKVLGETDETRIFRTRNFQIRVQPLRAIKSDKLAIRIQPALPPQLATTLHQESQVLDHLNAASGLVLICGPVGSGKTTTAASLVSFWASRRARHIATVEDPVEYIVNPQGGEVTQLNCSLTNQGVHGVPTLRKALTRLLRGDIDGLFVGEIRESEARMEVLDYAAMREPVVTTIHAGGIADAVLRVTKPEPGGVDQQSLRLALAQCLHTILYVGMAYSEKGDPVPVVLAAPGHIATMRNAIAEAQPKLLNSAINSALNNCSTSDGGIPPSMAYRKALEMGATQQTALAALPPDIRAEVSK